MGKSSAGNKLVGGGPKHSNFIKQEWPDSEGKQYFETRDKGQLHSVTKHCSVLTAMREDGDVRVLDTVGFAGSKSKEGPKDVHLGNLQVAREIAGLSLALDMAFDRVLYFLPYRGNRQTVDGTLQEEIDVMWHFFGEEIFKYMVLISTVDDYIQEALQESGVPIDKCAPNESEVRSLFTEAMKGALEQHDVPIANYPRCPEVTFFPLQTETSILVTQVKSVPVIGAKAFTPQFRKEACAKCASMLWGKGDTVVGVTVDADRRKINDACHPVFILKYSTLQRIVGGIAHVAVLGIAKLHELRTGKETWPGFFTSNEVCANCNAPPGSIGCLKVLQDTYMGETVEHSSNVEGVAITGS